MTISQVCLIHQWRIQYYDYNATEENQEFPFQNLLSGFDKLLIYWDVEISI